jgi:hypothetical protein
VQAAYALPKIFKILRYGMLGHMHEALNMDEKNLLHSLIENHEMNLLSIISL